MYRPSLPLTAENTSPMVPESALAALPSCQYMYANKKKKKNRPSTLSNPTLQNFLRIFQLVTRIITCR